MISGAFLMKKNTAAVTETGAGEEISNVQSVARKHIPVNDSDLDCVPDWQAVLADSERIYLDSTSTEPYVPPDTVTGQFSVPYFQEVLALQNVGLPDDALNEFTSMKIEELEAMTQERIYTEADLPNLVNTQDPEALRAYGNLVAGHIYYGINTEETEFEVFTRLTQDKNPKHLEKLADIEAQYEAVIETIRTLEVPESYIFEHLAVLNSLSAMKENVVGMQHYFDDSIYMLMRYRRIAEDTLGMSDSLKHLYDGLYLDDKIQFEENDALPVVVSLLFDE